jgi:formylglycine-generating enzyme required for sulfatase activity
MGSPAAEPDRNSDEAQREVTVTRSFALGMVPVTQGLWEAVTGQNPSRFHDRDDASQRPVETVSWFDAVRFCNALSVKLGLAPAYTIGDGDEPVVSCDFGATGFRLPTEQEWEYAARSGGDAFVYAGSDDLDEVGWYDQSDIGSTQPVAGKRPTRWGVYDLSGNVWEWCWDVYRDHSAGPDVSVAPGEERRVSRGGSWFSTAAVARAANRYSYYPGVRHDFLGVRLSRTIG